MNVWKLINQDELEPTWRQEGRLYLVFIVSVHQNPSAVPSRRSGTLGWPRPPTRLSLSRPRHRSNLLSLVHRCDQCLCATRPVCGGLVQPFLMTREIILIITLCKPVLSFSCTHTHTHTEHKSMHIHARAHTFAHFLPWSASLTSAGERKSLLPPERGNMWKVSGWNRLVSSRFCFFFQVLASQGRRHALASRRYSVRSVCSACGCRC